MQPCGSHSHPNPTEHQTAMTLRGSERAQYKHFYCTYAILNWKKYIIYKDLQTTNPHYIPYSY